MSYLKVDTVFNEGKNDYINVEGEITPQELTDVFFNIISHMVELDDEGEVQELLHMLILTHTKGFEDIAGIDV